MNVNTITRNTENYESGKLPIALYKSYMKSAEGKSGGYYGRAASRTTLSMQNIAEDVIVTKALEGYSTEQILKIWNVVNGAVIDRVFNGFIVDSGMGSFQARITGIFNSQQDTFDPERHIIDVGFRSSSKVKKMASELKPLILQANPTLPVIEKVTDVASHENGILTPQRMLTITGKNIMLRGENEDVGLYFINIDDDTKSTVVKENELGVNKATLITCDIPPLEAGTYRLKLVTQYSKGINNRKESVESFSRDTFTVKE